MNRFFYMCAVLSVFMAGSTFVSAQGGYLVKGTVEDKDGPLVGATVVEAGTSNGTSTGLDGDFSLTVGSGDSPVEISCIGYASVVYPASQVCM